MIKVSFIAIFALSFSVAVFAQVPDYVLKSEFYKNLSSSSDNFTMVFSDGYKMPIKGPYQLKESSMQPRCMCRMIDFTFIGANGVTETRSITFYPNKETIDFFGKDNKSYVVNQLVDKTGKPVAGLKDECDYIGKPNLVTIKNQNSCGDSLICYGSIKGCGFSEPAEVSCLATALGECPSAKACAEDPNVIFSKPKAILPPATAKPSETKSNVSNQ